MTSGQEAPIKRQLLQRGRGHDLLKSCHEIAVAAG
jgi:hypothetical protein